MGEDVVRCVLLADQHHDMAEGIRGLLGTVFPAVVMVGDETSLFECARRLGVGLAVVDLSLARGHGLRLVKRLRNQFPEMELIVISVHDQRSVARSVQEAGAKAFVLKRAIATDLLTAVDAVLAGQDYLSPGIPQV